MNHLMNQYILNKCKYILCLFYLMVHTLHMDYSNMDHLQIYKVIKFKSNLFIHVNFT